MICKKCGRENKTNPISHTIICFCGNRMSNPDMITETRVRSPKQKGEVEMSLNKEEMQTLDKVISEVEKEGIRLDNYKKQDPQGLGDTLEKVFSKFGVDETFIGKAMGIGGCGCQKRKKFLNQIFPYRKKN